MGCDKVNQMTRTIAVAAYIIVFLWLYHMQLGSIPLLLLAIYLFYKSYQEWKKPARPYIQEETETAEETPSVKRTQKKAGIVT